jgi:hypothetical protein
MDRIGGRLAFFQFGGHESGVGVSESVDPPTMVARNSVINVPSGVRLVPCGAT